MKKKQSISNSASYETRCYVVDSDNNVICLAGHFICMLSVVVNGPQDHVLVKYYSSNIDTLKQKNEKYSIYPKEQVFFTEWPVI